MCYLVHMRMCVACACAYVRMCACVFIDAFYFTNPSILLVSLSPPSPRSSTLKWLKLASAYAESPLRVGCLEWPLRISPQHALQLQMSAALRSTMPVKSRHSQVCLLWCVTKSCDLSPLSSLPPFFFVHEYFVPGAWLSLLYPLPPPSSPSLSSVSLGADVCPVKSLQCHLDYNCFYQIYNTLVEKGMLHFTLVYCWNGKVGNVLS